MTVRTLLHLGDIANRCVFINRQYCKAKMQQVLQYRQIRSLKRSQIFKSESSFPKAHIEIGTVSSAKLWKHLGFTIMFSGATIAGAAIWEYERIRSQTYRLIHRYRQFRIKRTGWKSEMESWWQNLTEGQKMFVPICFINAVIFLLWRVPTLQKTMVRYFCANPASSASCWSMVLSTFSHYSVIHLAANMYVLHSFSTIAVTALGKEQFLALYLSSGVISSFASHVYKNMFGMPGLSLGAAIKGIMALDVVGCILGWKYFDHAAHLGGALFGIFWQVWGNANIWQKREPLLSLWHEFREPPRS